MVRDNVSTRPLVKTGSWLLLLVCLWILVGCQITKQPTQAEIEQVLANYPSAHGLTKTIGTADNADTGIIYTYTTTDSEAAILAYYDQKLTQLGLEPSTESQARQINAMYHIPGCSGYDVRITISKASQAVSTLLVVTRPCH